MSAFKFQRSSSLHSAGLLPECSVGDPEQRRLKLKHALELLLVCMCCYRSSTAGWWLRSLRMERQMRQKSFFLCVCELDRFALSRTVSRVLDRSSITGTRFEERSQERSPERSPERSQERSRNDLRNDLRNELSNDLRNDLKNVPRIDPRNDLKNIPRNDLRNVWWPIATSAERLTRHLKVGR